MRQNPAAYQAIGLAGARAIAASDNSELRTQYVENILGAAIGVAAVAGVDTTGAAESMASTAAGETGIPLSSTQVANAASAMVAMPAVFDGWDAAEIFNLVIEENPNQDASPS